MTSFEIVEPKTLDDAFSWLDADDPAVRPIGGGTALMLMMKSQLFTPVRLVSLAKLGKPFFGFELSQDGSYLRIGAMTTFSELEHSPLIRKYFPAVAETMTTLANVRVRNVATIGGNLAHADPHLDLPPVWTALDAEVSLVRPGSKRTVPVEDLFSGYYETTIGGSELIAELRVPIRASWRSNYTKVTTRAAHDWPALGLAVSLKMDNRRIEDLRIVLSAAIDKPTRLREAEQILRGSECDEEVLKRAGEAASHEVDISSDMRGSEGYKRHLLRVYLRRAVTALVGS